MAHLRGGSTTLTEAEVQRVARHFVDPDYLALDNIDYTTLDAEHPGFARWRSRNTRAHKKPGYVAVTLSLKPTGVAPGDLTDKQLDAVADLAERYSFGYLRTSTSRTSSSPMSSSASCTPSGWNCASKASPPRTSAC